MEKIVDGEIPVFAGAVVVADDGRILCQLRDNKPGIHYPGYWSCSPGGHVEQDESPNDAIVRELYEEFEIRVENLNRLTTVVETEGDVAGTYHAFMGQLAIPISDVKCHEGVRAVFFSTDEALRLRQHPVSRKILLEYMHHLTLF